VLIMSSHFLVVKMAFFNLVGSDDFHEPAPYAMAAKTSYFRTARWGCYNR
jgi:hypothetical protein